MSMSSVRGLGLPAHQVNFALLAKPALLKAPIREIAEAAGASKSSVANQLGRLSTQGFLVKTSEGAKLVLDGRVVKVPGYEGGYFVGPTILDHVKPGMYVGDYEIFGPVTSIKRVKDFEEGLAIMNANPFANGSCIYTTSGRYAREFARRTDGGMVGVNVGIPVPFGIFPFSGHKQSFFGDLHTLGKDGVAFFTETKSVTSVWFSEEDAKKAVSTWDGTLTRG